MRLCSDLKRTMLLHEVLCRGAIRSIVPAATTAIASTSGIARFASSDARDGKKSIGIKELEDLAKASPTGSLLDLFAPDALGPSSTSQPSPAQLPFTESGKKKGRKDIPQTSECAVQVMLKATENCKPLIKVQSINTGARIIVVPKPVTPNEQQSMALRWIVGAARKRQEASKKLLMSECLAIELLLAYRKEGAAREKRDEVHRLALENKNNVGGYRLK